MKIVKVDLRVPPGLEQSLRALAEQGLLGDTINEVALHIIREALFQRVTELKRTNAPDQPYLPIVKPNKRP